MQSSAKNLFAKAKELHSSVYFALREVQHAISQCDDIKELCDFDLAADEAHEFIYDLKKELWNLREEINAKICTLFVQAAVNDPVNAKRSVHTDYVTATPDISQSPNIPSAKTDPDAYLALMKYIGVDTSTWTKNEKGELNEAVKFHWPGLTALVTKHLSAGLPVPPGIDLSKLKPVFKVALRKKRDVLDESDTTESLKEQLKALDEELSGEGLEEHDKF